ncbi:hypothetical protein GEMRC1_005141 [Eukaryota sp. GEM-RC1]
MTLLYRQHGLQFPLDTVQIISWLLFAFFSVGFYFLLLPFLPHLVYDFVVIPYSVFLLFGIALKILCSYIDPKDPNVEYDKISKASKSLPPGFRVIDEHRYCCICKTFVTDKAKHCKLCNKCVEHFDHHCKYINNCVSKTRNYKPFFCLVIIMSVLSLSVAIGTCFIVFLILVGPLRPMFKVVSLRWLRIIGLSLLGVLSIPVSYLIIQLLVFHIGLVRNKITTYDFIVRSRKRRDPIPKKVIEQEGEEKTTEILLRRPTLDNNSAGSSTEKETSLCTPSCIIKPTKLD